MSVKRDSSYRTKADREFVANWVDRVQSLNGSTYERINVPTTFGETAVFAHNRERSDLTPLVVLPGARTFGMFWELNDSLRPLKARNRIFLIDVVGQPGLSSGTSPRVKSDGFGRWLVEVLDGLGLHQANFVGASFGGQLAIKLANHAPRRINKLILLNPIGFSYISLAPQSLFYNLLPIVRPTRANVVRFVDHIVLAGREGLTGERRELLNEIILQTLVKFKFGADYPYRMGDLELSGWKVPTYIIVGEDDALIPHETTIRRARKTVQDLREVHVLGKIGHGVELSPIALELVGRILQN